MKVSIIIPVLNEEKAIREKLPRLQHLRDSGHELIIVDGGSSDSSKQLAENGSDALITTVKGRARQMNAGARVASGELLLFLHIDTDLPASGIETLTSNYDGIKQIWGRFNISLSGKHYMFRVIEAMMNWRSRITGIATGDQAIFVSKSLFERIGGFAEMPLMEDIDICTRLKRIMKPLCLSEKVTTSTRRWESSGIYRTIWLMWRLRLSYWLGKDPEQLVHHYYQ